MASIKKRKSTFSVIYWYLDNAGERKQKWDTLETKKEAKQSVDQHIIICHFQKNK